MINKTVREVAKVLETNKLIRHLKLSDCLLGDDGKIRAAKLMISTHTVYHLPIKAAS